MAEPVRKEVINGIMVVTINRPEKRNAINHEVMDHLSSILKATKNDVNIKGLAIRGAGTDAFCSGGDLSEFHELHTEKEAYPMLSKMSTILYDLFTYPKPTFALINGSAVGGGCELAAACDFRYASQGAEVGFIQAHLGITTGWGGATFLFERLRSSDALEWLMAGKKLTAEEAQSLGYIQKVLPGESFLNVALKEAQELCTPPVTVLEAYKKYLLEKLDLPSIQKRVDREVRQCSILWESEEHHQAVQRFLNK